MDLAEHLINPLQAFEMISRSIKPGGYLLILTGNASSVAPRIYKGLWYYFNYAEHITFFSPQSVELSMRKVNIDIEKMFRIRHHTHAVSFLARQVLSYAFKKKERKHMDNFHLPSSPVQRGLLLVSRLINGNDHLMAIGRKKEA